MSRSCSSWRRGSFLAVELIACLTSRVKGEKEPECSHSAFLMVEGKKMEGENMEHRRCQQAQILNQFGEDVYMASQVRIGKNKKKRSDLWTKELWKT